MMLFFDTSALVKFFHRERGTDVVVSMISSSKEQVFGGSHLGHIFSIMGDSIEDILVIEQM
jgi:PIN domain nuclease of toxin-antitoxin system